MPIPALDITPGRKFSPQISMNSLADQEELVKEELFKFIRKYIPSAQLSQIDEIVLSYVVSILEELGSEYGGGEDNFDLDSFCEMMAAYLPEFSIIQPEVVCAWMFDLSASLSQSRKKVPGSPPPIAAPARDPAPDGSSGSSGSHGSSDVWELPPPSLEGGSKRPHHLSETSDTSEDSGDFIPTQEEQAYLSTQLQMLQEMFPAAFLLELRHCLAIAGGDAEQAAQLVLHRQEAGQSLTPQSSVQNVAGRQKPTVDDQELKERIIARYSYIDRAEASREHRPVAPKSEPKKLIRYRDNKIVSLKGERFTEVKKEDSEDPTATKKSLVPLKPPRQFRCN